MARAIGQYDASVLLREFLSATTESSADQALEELVSTCIEPTIRSALKHKIRTSFSEQFVTPDDLDSLELISDIEAQIIKELRMRRLGAVERKGLSNLAGYVRTASANRFRQYIREKYPERFRLKNKIIYIMQHSPGLQIWVDASGTRLCGRTELQGSSKKSTAHASFDEIVRLVEETNAAISGLVENQPLIELVRNLVGRLSVPTEVDTLTTVVARHIGIAEAITFGESEPESPVGGTTEADQLRTLEDRVELEAVWGGIMELSPELRAVVLLNLRGGGGENALAYLPILRVASITQIAEALDMGPEDLLAIWHDLPLDDNAIAQRLGVTRQKVINLRQSARTKLLRTRANE
ncbi:MAG TPA: hypothetical protein VMM38_15660 [Aridibacter sp.]|nr:hypothetical protein [Aridibacter sp.]